MTKQTKTKKKMEVPYVTRRVSMDTFHRNFYQSDLGKLLLTNQQQPTNQQQQNAL